MSLRARLTLAVAVLVAVVIALSGFFSVLTARSELEAEVDDFLVERVSQIEPILDIQRSRISFDVPGDPRENDRQSGTALFRNLLVNPDAVTQIIDSNGTVQFTSDVTLPVTDADVRLANASDGRRIFHTITVDGTPVRIIAASTDRPLAIMVARDLSEVDQAVDGIASRTLLLGILGSALAALVAWVLSTRLTRPIAKLTTAAEHVAATQDLSAPIDVASNDEVGRLAGSFNTMLQALDTSRQQQHRLVMDASHELRTPLTSLQTNVDFLRRASTLDAETRGEILNDVNSEVGELSNLVAELVDLATSTTRSDEAIVQVPLAAMVSEAVDRASRRTTGTVEITTGDMAEVMARPAMLQRAINNLLDNAIKFGGDESRIDVAVDGGRVAVRDHGPGISAEDRSRVFDRFYRATATRTEPGSGLGLAIVHEVVTSLEGRVFITDPPSGEGVVVGFELPTVP